MLTEKLIAPRCPIPADDLNFTLRAAHGCRQIRQEIEERRIEAMNFAGSMVAQEPVQPGERLGDIGPVAPVYDVDALASVGVIKPEPGFPGGAVDSSRSSRSGQSSQKEENNKIEIQHV